MMKTTITITKEHAEKALASYPHPERSCLIEKAIDESLGCWSSFNYLADIEVSPLGHKKYLNKEDYDLCVELAMLFDDSTGIGFKKFTDTETPFQDLLEKLPVTINLYSSIEESGYNPIMMFKPLKGNK